MSKLLKAMEEETELYGRSADEQLKAFARALDSSREVGPQEITYRALGLGMCVSSRVTKFINTNKPEERDGLLKGNLDTLQDDENPFMNGIIDYYVNRPSELEELTLSDFCAEYDLVIRGTTKEGDTMDRDPYNEDEDSGGRGEFYKV